MKFIEGDHNDIAQALSSIGVSYGRLGFDLEALENKLKALEMRERLFKDDHPDTACSLRSLAVTYEKLGHDQKALEFYLKSFEMR